jgi:hypothetical protein
MSILDLKLPPRLYDEPPSPEGYDDERDKKMPATTTEMKKSVQFSEFANCCTIPHRDDLSPEAFAEIWYQQEEFMAIKAENTRITHMLLRNGRRFLHDEEENIDSGRGLEFRLPDHGQRRRKIMTDASNAVLDEQELQRDKKINDPDFIAQGYREVACSAQGLARTVGLQDEKDALQTAAAASSGVGSENKKQARRSISFFPNVAVNTIIHVDEFTDEERRELWYQKDEYKEMKKQLRIGVQTFLDKRPQLIEDDEFVLRGLEYMIPANAKIKRRNKCYSLCAVLDEQDRQDQVGTHDPEKIARGYRGIATHCLLTAQNRARGDARFARAYTAEDRACWNKEKPAPPPRSLLTKILKNCDTVHGESTIKLTRIALTNRAGSSRKNNVATRIARIA